MNDDHTRPSEPMPPQVLMQAGTLPFRRGPVRFAVGRPDGLTSNSWKIWTNPKGDIYIVCRDNLRDVRVSLHTSGRWRMGFTTKALAKTPNLVWPGQDRAWEVWDKPPPTLPDTTVAFRLLFPASELAVRREQRAEGEWRGVWFIEGPPPGKLTVLTLFITNGDIEPKHATEPSFRLASLAIGSNTFAQLVAHGEPEGNLPGLIDQVRADARRKMAARAQEIPAEAYLYALGRHLDGSRYLVGARAVPAQTGGNSGSASAGQS